jgi:hypothetical protein
MSLTLFQLLPDVFGLEFSLAIMDALRYGKFFSSVIG